MNAAIHLHSLHELKYEVNLELCQQVPEPLLDYSNSATKEDKFAVNRLKKGMESGYEAQSRTVMVGMLEGKGWNEYTIVA